MRLLHDESGQTVILAAFCMAVLLGFLALAVDVGILFHARRTVQTAADSAAIAGAQEILYGDVTSAARADAALNGITNGVNGATVSINNPPINGPFARNVSYVEVITTQPQLTYFMNVFGTRSVNVTGRAVATSSPVQTCVYTLNPTGTSFAMSGGANVQMPGCGVMVESSNSSALTISGGSTLNAASIGVVGGYSVVGGSFISPNPAAGITPSSDPLSYLQPPPFTSSACLPNPYIGNGATVTLGLGGTTCYNGLSVAGGSTVRLSPGIYVINGSLSLGGGASFSGSDVTLYFPSGGSVSIAGGTVINLSAPTSGTYNGILFYEDRIDTQSASISGGASSVLQGIFYFPKASLVLNGGTSTQIYASVIVGALQLSGGTNLKNYAIVNPGTPLSSPRLAE